MKVIIDYARKTIFIPSDWITPDTKGLSFKEHCKKLDLAYGMAYDTRIALYATREEAQEIEKARTKNPNYKLSEYTT